MAGGNALPDGPHGPGRGRPRGARAEDGQAARRRLGSAARLGALRCAVLDARDDGHRPQPRPQRRLRARASRKQTGNERFAYDSYRRFVQMFGKIVLDVPGDLFEEKLHELVEEQGLHASTPSSAPTTSTQLVEHVQGDRARRSRRRLPRRSHRAAPLRDRGRVQVVERQARRATTASSRGIADDLGTAVNVQAMVFGNKGDDSGTGVAFTRNPSTGESAPYGDFLKNAQGEDVVAGIRITEPLDAMSNEFPEPHKELLGVMKLLENHYRDMCDIEFTIEQGRLFMLQTRVGKRTAAAALRMAVEMVDEGLDRRARSGAARAARAARPAPAPAVRPQGRVPRAGEGPERVAGRGGRQGVLHRRRGRGAPRGRRARDPRAARDVARRPARHDRGRRDPHVARRPRCRTRRWSRAAWASPRSAAPKRW